MRPGFYPDRPSQVEVKRTHVSSVFLVGEYVYQVKDAGPLRFCRLFDVRGAYGRLNASLVAMTTSGSSSSERT